MNASITRLLHGASSHPTVGLDGHTFVHDHLLFPNRLQLMYPGRNNFVGFAELWVFITDPGFIPCGSQYIDTATVSNSSSKPLY